MKIDDCEFIQVAEKHYKSCIGCHFHAPDDKVKCNLKAKPFEVVCEDRIWIKR